HPGKLETRRPSHGGTATMDDQPASPVNRLAGAANAVSVYLATPTKLRRALSVVRDGYSALHSAAGRRGTSRTCHDVRLESEKRYAIRGCSATGLSDGCLERGSVFGARLSDNHQGVD